MDAGARRPAPDFRGLTLGFTAGVLATHALPRLPSLPVLLALGACALLPWRGRAWLATAICGLLFTVLRAQPLLAERWPAARQNEEVQVAGTVVSLPDHARDAGRFLFQPDADARRAGLPSRLRVSWYEGAGRVRAAECWNLELRLHAPHGSLDPGGSDYEAWLFRQGIGATATVRDGTRCADSGGEFVLRARRAIVERLKDWLPGAPGLGLLAAITVGDTSGIRDDDWDVFRLTGTSHLVAISGFNIGIVAGVAFLLFRGLWSLWPRLCLWLPAQRAALLGSVLGALLYAGLAGFEAPVLRAVLMLAVLAAAAWLHRLAEPSRALALALLAILLLDPESVLAPGLWLSFGAVGAIFYVSTGRLKAPGFWHSAVFLQLMLSLVLAPLTLYFFQGASLAGPLVNLLAVPYFAVITPFALGGLILAWVWPAAGVPVLGVTAASLDQFRQVLEALATLPRFWLPASPSPLALVCAAFGALLLFAPRGLPVRALAVLCFAPLLFPADRAPSRGFELTALDVGQGLAVVVRTAHHALLFDAGPAFEEGFDAGEAVDVPYLLRDGVRDLDLLLISHGDNDHAGGAAAVRGHLNVRAVMGVLPDAAPCRDGTRWNWDGVDFQILHPDARDWGDNNGSCVLRVSAPGFSALLPGDIEKKAEARLVAEHPDLLRADVLLAPHHGSKTSSTSGFVEAVHPKLVIFSAGWHSRFGHPKPEVVERYVAVGARPEVTGNVGAVTAKSGREGRLEVSEWRREAAKFWNARAEP